jgi:hypothetical protein
MSRPPSQSVQPNQSNQPNPAKLLVGIVLIGYMVGVVPSARHSMWAHDVAQSQWVRLVLVLGCVVLQRWDSVIGLLGMGALLLTVCECNTMHSDINASHPNAGHPNTGHPNAGQPNTGQPNHITFMIDPHKKVRVTVDPIDPIDPIDSADSADSNESTPAHITAEPHPPVYPRTTQPNLVASPQTSPQAYDLDMGSYTSLDDALRLPIIQYIDDSKNYAYDI